MKKEGADSLSKYIFYNGREDIICQDKDGNIMNGARLDAEAGLRNEIYVIRFRNGYLDGDVYAEDGTFKMQLPAVEGKNHQEFWRKNKLHRDGCLPAIVSGNPPVYEYWINGVKQEEPPLPLRKVTLQKSPKDNDKFCQALKETLKNCNEYEQNSVPKIINIKEELTEKLTKKEEK